MHGQPLSVVHEVLGRHAGAMTRITLLSSAGFGRIPIGRTHLVSLQASAPQRIECHFKRFRSIQQNVVPLRNDVNDDE